MNLKFFAGVLAVIIIIALPLFGHLSELPMQRWDEARLAIAAYEMGQTHNWLVPSLVWQPDMISVKPPLFIWLQVLSIKALGANILATRLPAALAAVATCLFLYWFLTKKIKSQLAGILAPAILIVSAGYVRLHGTRTGDYDTLLALFTTISLLYCHLYLSEKKPKYIIVAAIALSLACLTKGVAGLMFLPAVFIMTIYHNQLKSLLTTKEFYIGIGIFIVSVPGYYILREVYTPGYLQAVADNELGGRFLTTLETHHHPWYFYFEKLYQTGRVWILFPVFGLIMSLTIGSREIKQLAVYLSVAILTFLIVISSAGTKLDWYSLPVYPLLSILAAMAVYHIFIIIKKQTVINKYLGYILPLACLLIIYTYGYYTILDSVLRPKTDLSNRYTAFGLYLHNIHKDKTHNEKIFMLYSDLEQEMIWYDHIDERLDLKSVRKLSPGDNVIAHKDESIAVVESSYDYTLLGDFYGVKRYRITGIRQIPVIPPQ